MYAGLSLVEVYYGGQWGTVCPNYYNISAQQIGRVVCRQLGYQHLIKATSAYLLNYYNTQFDANPNQKVLLVVDSCKGSEKDIKDCNHGGFGQINRCSHIYDELVRCSACKYIRVTL